MTLQELYDNMDGDYEQAMRVLRVEKLVDKHIRKFVRNGVIEALLEAREEMKPEVLFDRAHAVKGISASLGLKEIAGTAAEISDEFRPGSTRRYSDREVADKIDHIALLYQKTAEQIRRYEES